MIWIAVCIIGGILLILAEVFVPGAILGILGGLLLVTASILTLQDYGWFPALLVAMSSGIGAIASFFIGLKGLEKSGMSRQMFLKGSLKSGDGRGDEHNHDARQALVGKTGRTLTTMAPSGRVEVDGQFYEAYSESGLLSRDTDIEIVSVDVYRLIVRKVSRTAS